VGAFGSCKFYRPVGGFSKKAGSAAAAANEEGGGGSAGDKEVFVV
jgi:hypothetical protein